MSLLLEIHKDVNIMRILLINSYYYPQEIGGAEVSVRKLAEGLVKDGNEVYVVCNGNNIEEIINNVNVIRINFNEIEARDLKINNKLKKLYKKITSINNIFKYKKIKDRINKINPDIVHSNNLYNISPIIWKICKQLNIPIVHTLRDYYLTCPKATLICEGKLCVNKKSICKIYEKYNGHRLKNVDMITAPSEFTLDLFKNNKLIVNSNSKVVYNAIDKFKNTLINLDEIRFDRLKDSKTKFCFLGSLIEYKGVKKMIETFKDINADNIELHIAGSGELEEYVINNVKQDERIFYHGKLKEYEVESLILKCDVMIVPSLWYEPFGRVVIDAYKYGMPVIASNLGGLKEIVINEETGLLINCENKKEFIRAIEIMKDKQYVYQMKEKCLKMVEKFGIDKQVNEFEDIYINLIKEKCDSKN